MVAFLILVGVAHLSYKSGVNDDEKDIVGSITCPRARYLDYRLSLRR